MKDDIIIAGDLHGDWGSINTLINVQDPAIVLQCGDFGWWPQLEASSQIFTFKNRWKLKGIKPGNTEVHFCDGNHENYDELTKYKNPTELYKNVFYQPRGSLFQLPDGRVVLFIGGADSVDKDQRIYRVSWYPEELINGYELDNALKHNQRIDIVISHTCPKEFEVLGEHEAKYKDPCREALSRVLEKYRPSQWFFGHWHRYQTGCYNGTYWTCLDYPKHRSQWWVKLK